MKNEGFIGWLKTAKGCKLKCSVCTGSLLLGAAGFLDGKKATSHPTKYHLLHQYGATVTPDKVHPLSPLGLTKSRGCNQVVDEGDVITARGVSSAINLGVYLVGLLAGAEVQKKIQTQMDFQGEIL